ncbi:toxin-antitoxin system YwqK family antitoxin [Polaribacter sp.]|uniref:toxin-antitoxin system YwqK family antitoxin n=1 Tax=Polaribacter sp. TaxID=1920175 RepID=UPI003F6CED44
MLNIKRLSFVLLFSTFFFATIDSNAQKINQFNDNNKRTGVWRKYHPNKRIRYTGRFKNGKEIGVFKFYDITDSKYPTIIKKFSATSDSVDVSFYSVNGVLKSKGFFVDKKRVGAWEYYFSDGKIMSKEFYKDGKLEGELINYYPNKKPAEITEYKNGLKNGVSKKYSSDGVLIEEVEYKDGKPNGLAKYFELNGDLRETGMYKNGKREGKWEFYMDGEIASEKDINKKKIFTKTNKNK